MLELLPLAGFHAGDRADTALRDPRTAAGLTAGLRSGRDAMARVMIDMEHEADAEDRADTLSGSALAVTLPTVAVHPGSGDVVGACLCQPPLNVMHRVDELVPRASPHERWSLRMGALMAVTRLSALAVDPEARGQGLGSSLVALSIASYRRNAFHTMYGQIRRSDHPTLSVFYGALGFDVLPPRQPIDMGAVFGFRVGPTPTPGEQLFHRTFA